MKKVFFCTLLLVLTLAVGMAGAAGLSMYVQPAEDDPAVMSDTAVYLYWSSSRACTLFLPAGMDASRLRVVFDKQETITVDGTTLRSGEETALFGTLIGQTVKLSYGSTTVSL